MVSASIKTSPSSMQTTTITMHSASKYFIIRCLSLPLGWQRHLGSDYKSLRLKSPTGFVTRYSTHTI